jgi:hypothetical protein
MGTATPFHGQLLYGHTSYNGLRVTVLAWELRVGRDNRSHEAF